jgi:hypothetical protein
MVLTCIPVVRLIYAGIFQSPIKFSEIG